MRLVPLIYWNSYIPFSGGGGYYNPDPNGNLYLVPVPKYTETLNGDFVIDVRADFCYWTKPIIVESNKITSSYITIAGKTQSKFYTKNKHLIFQIDNLPQINIFFSSDLLPSDIVKKVNGKCAKYNPNYKDVLLFVNDHFVFTNRTPRFAPVLSTNSKIRIINGDFLGFTNNTIQIGSLPVDYRKFKYFIVCKKKISNEKYQIEQFYPIIEDNYFIKRCFAGYDQELISNNTRTKLLFDAFAWSLDCAEREADQILNAYDPINIDSQNLPYLARTLGFQLPNIENLVTSDSKREFVKNLISLYKQKGTIDSYKTTFKFLQYNADIQEKRSLTGLPDNSSLYPDFTIIPTDADVISYYNNFVNSSTDSFFTKYNWFYKSNNKNIAFQNYNQIPIISGLTATLKDSSGFICSVPSYTIPKNAPWNLTDDTGYVDFTVAPNPAFSINEFVYAGTELLGQVLYVVDSKTIILHNIDRIVASKNLLAKNFIGSAGAGGITPGQLNEITTSNRLRMSIDNEVVDIDFSEFNGFYSSGQEFVTETELANVFKEVFSNNNINASVDVVGNSVKISSRLYGGNASVIMKTSNYALGIIKNNFSVIHQPETIIISIGTAEIEGQTASLLADEIRSLDSTKSYKYYVYIDSLTSQLKVIDDTELVSGYYYPFTGVCELTNRNGGWELNLEDNRSNYTIPSITDLKSEQYHQIYIYKKYNTLNTEIQNVTDPVTHQVTMTPALGRSIFVDLYLQPFVEHGLSYEDIRRILYLVEFLRPVHVVFNTIVEAINTTETIKAIGKYPLDLPTTFLDSNTEGQNIKGYYDEFQAGLDITSPIYFNWLGFGTGIKKCIVAPGHGILVGDALTIISGSQTVISIALKTTATEIYFSDNSWQLGSIGTINGLAYSACIPVSEITTRKICYSSATTDKYISPQWMQYHSIINFTSYNNTTGDLILPTNFISKRHRQISVGDLIYIAGTDYTINAVDANNNLITINSGLGLVPSPFAIKHIFNSTLPVASWNMPLWTDTELTVGSDVAVPNRLALWQYPDLWADIKLGTKSLFDATKQAPKWDINEGSTSFVKDFSQSELLVIDANFIQAKNYSFQKFKPVQLPTLTRPVSEQGLPLATIYVKSVTGDESWAYIRWQTVAYPSILEPENIAYVFKDIRGLNSGWNGTPTLAVSNILECKLFVGSVYAGGVADRLEFEIQVSETEIMKNRVSTIYTDSPIRFCGHESISSGYNAYPNLMLRCGDVARDEALCVINHLRDIVALISGEAVTIVNGEVQFGAGVLAALDINAGDFLWVNSEGAYFTIYGVDIANDILYINHNISAVTTADIYQSVAHKNASADPDWDFCNPYKYDTVLGLTPTYSSTTGICFQQISDYQFCKKDKIKKRFVLGGTKVIEDDTNFSTDLTSGEPKMYFIGDAK